MQMGLSLTGGNLQGTSASQYLIGRNLGTYIILACASHQKHKLDPGHERRS